MKALLRSAIIILFVLVFSGTSKASEIKGLISFPYYDKDYYDDFLREKLGDPPIGEVFTDRKELLEFCNKLIIDGDKVVKRELRNKLENFSDHLILVIIGEYSTMDYNITINESKTDFSEGVLTVVVNITDPPREKAPEGTREMQSNKPKNPLYIYYTDPSKVPISRVEKVKFYEERPNGQLELFSGWEKPGE